MGQLSVLTVQVAPLFTSRASATAAVGSAFNFTAQAYGTPTMTESGALPQGLTWVDNGNGTATLAGTPSVGQGGVYHLTFTAANAFGTTTQAFTLTVDGGSLYVPLGPVRILDTRNGTGGFSGPIGPGGAVSYTHLTLPTICSV